MKVLIIGSGGREHTLAVIYSKSPLVTKVYVAPGNGLMDYKNATIKTFPEIFNDWALVVTVKKIKMSKLKIRSSIPLIFSKATGTRLWGCYRNIKELLRLESVKIVLIMKSLTTTGSSLKKILHHFSQPAVFRNTITQSLLSKQTDHE